MVARTGWFERLLISGARLLSDGDVAFVGFHWPMLIARVARRLSAPHLIVLYEDGIVEDELTPVLPTSPSDLAAASGSPSCAGSFDALYMWLGGGRVDWTLLEAPIVDRRGNVNTTAIGNYERPAVRLPGSGGGAELASFGRGLVLVSASLSPRSYPERVDYITSPGYLDEHGERQRSGYREGSGPRLLLNPLGVFEFSGEELHAQALHHDVTQDDVRSCFGWEIEVGNPGRLPPPSPTELMAARQVIDEARSRQYRIPDL